MPIWKQRLLSRLQSPEGDGNAGGSGGDGGSKIAPEVQKLIDDAVTGLKAKNGELIGQNKDLKKELDTFRGQFEGFDIEAVKGLLAKASKDDETKMIAEGKIDEVLSKRTERLKADLEKRVNDALAQAEAAQKLAKSYQGRVLDDSVRAAAAKAGLHSHAVEDALLYARTLFTLDADGNAVALGEDGKPVLGKDGKSPFAPAEWLEGMKEKKPHWFPASASGGGANSGGGAGSQGSKKAKDMSPQEKADYIQKNGISAWSEKVRADYG